MGRTFVMGDIHGNDRGLLQCLERSGFDNTTDTLIQLGDVADGWPQTAECVETLVGIRNLISIRGNHDVWVYDWFKSGAQPILWTQQGGQATIDSYVKTGLLQDSFHREFWENQIDWHIDDKNRLFIHAGWDYIWGFPEGAAHGVNAGSIARECHWDRGLLMSARASKNGKFKPLEQFHEIYIGHTAVQSALPENILNLWNLDTGSGWHGKLTIMDIDTKEYWQSDYAPELYPEVTGRGGRK